MPNVLPINFNIQEGRFCVSSLRMYINLSSIVLSLKSLAIYIYDILHIYMNTIRGSAQLGITGILRDKTMEINCCIKIIGGKVRTILVCKTQIKI